MPNKNSMQPTRRSCDHIVALMRNHLPEVFRSHVAPVLRDILNIEKGAFHRRVENYRCVGWRIPERKSMEIFLSDRGIERKDIVRDLGVDESTVGRFFNGVSSTELNERICIRYTDQLTGFKHPEPAELLHSSYRYAIEKLREDILKAIQRFERAVPSLTEERFCCLWHMILSESWGLAVQSQSEPQLESAAIEISNQVKRSAPIYEQCRCFSAAELKRLHEVWGLWFRLVTYCELDHSSHDFGTEQSL